jgi:hypothetical protein
MGFSICQTPENCSRVKGSAAVAVIAAIIDAIATKMRHVAVVSFMAMHYP